MKPGFYKHKRAMDIVYEVLQAHDYGFTPSLTLIGYWWNLGYTGCPWRLDYCPIAIKNEDIPNWEYLGDTPPKRFASK